MVDLDFVKEFFRKGEDYERFVLDYQPPEKTNKIIKQLSFD
jgi:hypothetical protein